MLSKFFKSIYFNAIMSVIGAFIVIIQEVNIGTAATLPFFNLFAFGAVSAAAFSWGVEVCKAVFFDGIAFTWKKALVGSIVGIVAAIIFIITLV